MDKFDANRRKLLALGGVALGAAILPTPAFATLSTPRPRILTLNNLHTGESIKAEFFDGRGYIQEELAKLNHFFRDYRANKIKSIDPGLFDQLYRLQGLLGTRKPVQLISGYRSIDTNNELRARSRGVAKKSYHTKGQAMDFHIEGIALSNIRKAALSMRAGGVGYYPRSNFMDKFDANRRKLLALGGVALGAAILPTPAFATLSTPRPRILTLNNLHTGESIKAEFFDGRGYIQEELAKLNHFFRDYRANKIKSIDPGLFDQLYRLQGLLGTRKPVQLISGYRSIDTNNELRARSRGVAKKSYHTKGQAMDFHIEGIALSNIRKAALSMRAGGVGYYPRSNFVHIDTGPARHW